MGEYSARSQAASSRKNHSTSATDIETARVYESSKIKRAEQLFWFLGKQLGRLILEFQFHLILIIPRSLMNVRS